MRFVSLRSTTPLGVSRLHHCSSRLGPGMIFSRQGYWTLTFRLIYQENKTYSTRYQIRDNHTKATFPKSASERPEPRLMPKQPLLYIWERHLCGGDLVSWLLVQDWKNRTNKTPLGRTLVKPPPLRAPFGVGYSMLSAKLKCTLAMEAAALESLRHLLPYNLERTTRADVKSFDSDWSKLLPPPNSSS